MALRVRDHGYPLNWGEIAEAVKAVAGWRCEACGYPHDVETWHVLTVHHLNGDKADCRYTNLVALCQRCHLHVQALYLVGQLWLPDTEPPYWVKARGLTYSADWEGVWWCDAVVRLPAPVFERGDAAVTEDDARDELEELRRLESLGLFEVGV